MSVITGGIRTHAVFAELATLEQAVELSREVAQADAACADAFDRIEHVTKFVRIYLIQLDPLLIPQALLGSLQQPIAQARQHLNNFVSGRHISHLQNANSQFDVALEFLGRIPRIDQISSVKVLEDVATSYKKSINDLIRTLKMQLNTVEADKKSLQLKLIDLTAEVTIQKQRADSVIAQMQQQFSTAQDARQTEAKTVESKRASDFDTAEKLRDAKNDVAQDRMQNRFSEFLTSAETQHQELCRALENNTSALISSLETQKIRAEKVVGIISTEAVAHGYGKTANEEREAAILWRWVAVVTLCSWIGAGVCFFWLTYDEDLSLTALARQFLISVPFVLLSGFAALQVTKHQRIERTNRQQELEIAAIDPYLATFSDEVRDEVKRSLAEKIFGQRETDLVKVDSKQVHDMFTDLVKTVKQLQESLTKK